MKNIDRNLGNGVTNFCLLVNVPRMLRMSDASLASDDDNPVLKGLHAAPEPENRHSSEMEEGELPDSDEESLETAEVEPDVANHQEVIEAGNADIDSLDTAINGPKVQSEDRSSLPSATRRLLEVDFTQDSADPSTEEEEAVKADFDAPHSGDNGCQSTSDILEDESPDKHPEQSPKRVEMDPEETGFKESHDQGHRVENLADVLEEMTEESAKEIFDGSNEISDKTKEVIAKFSQNEDECETESGETEKEKTALLSELANEWSDNEAKEQPHPMEDVVDEFADEEPPNSEEKFDSLVEKIVINPKPIILKKRRSKRKSSTGSSKRIKLGKPQPQKCQTEEEDIDEIGKIVDFIKDYEQPEAAQKTESNRVETNGRKTPQNKENVHSKKSRQKVSQNKKAKRRPEASKNSKDKVVAKPEISQPEVNKSLTKRDQKELDTEPKKVKKKPSSKRRSWSKGTLKRKRSVTATTTHEQTVKESSTKDATEEVKTSCYFKPIQNWHKILRLPNQYVELGAKWTETQVFRNVLPPYVPCVPPNTSQRLIEALTEREVDQLSCPGCKDRFLLPTSFFQHLYRKSVLISFVCGPCGNLSMSFHNKCHLRVHILSHLELDGSSSVPVVEPETLSVSSLSEDLLSVGFVDQSFNEELGKLDTEFKSFSVDNCTECLAKIGSANLVKHFQADASVECDLCHMYLPSACAWKAHQRIHRGRQPYVCPECGTTFETQPMFAEHVQTTCQHEGRVLAVQCKICQTKNLSNSLVDQDSILAHVYQTHIKLYYKCSECPKAFVTKPAIYNHRSKSHAQEEDKADFTLLYKASFLGSKNLFGTRTEFEKRMNPLFEKWQRCYTFKCLACQTYFETPEDLRSHNSKWCQLQTGNKIVSKLFKETKLACKRDLIEKEKVAKLESNLKTLQSLCSDGSCEGCSVISQTMQTHVEEHKNKGPKNEQKTEDVETEEDVPNQIRITRQRIIESPATPAPPVVKQESVVAPIPDPPPEVKDEKLKKAKTSKRKKIEVKSFVESLGKDMLSDKRLLAYNRLGRKSLVFGSTVSTKTAEDAAYKCGLCDFTTNTRDSFQAHILIHRPVGSEFFQCKQCGMSFASEPSWKKHLFLLHRIKKPNPDEYCEDLVRSEPETADSIGEHSCSVCNKRFLTDLELRRHFRGHGMAFLKSNA